MTALLAVTDGEQQVYERIRQYQLSAPERKIIGSILEDNGGELVFANLRGLFEDDTDGERAANEVTRERFAKALDDLIASGQVEVVTADGDVRYKLSLA